ncbi:MAG TPA: class I SAM-dependent methyltransferase [Patescibacteria group bacterium]|nr:class I SAM-dependent methyltransferase [Patescibacteria group bacterium]
MNRFEQFVINSPLRALAQEFIEIRSLRRRVTVAKNKVILELGCGNGTGTKLIKKYFRPKHLYAIDNDPSRIELAKQKVRDQSITFEVADVVKLPYKSESIDIVLDFSVLYHIDNWKEALKEIKRVLKPGGQFILEDLSIEGLSRDFGKVFRKMFMHTYKRPYKRDEFFAYFVAQGWHLTSKKVFSPLGFEYFIVVAGKPLKN